MCELVLCHLVSSCVIVQTCSHVVVIFVMVCDGVDFEHSCLHLCFLQQHWGLKTPQQPKDAGFVCEMAKWIGEKSVPLIFGSGASGSVIAIAWNATEQDRMARAIQKGRFRPKKPDEFQLEFLNFDLPAIHRGLGKNGMVALIGMQATGKTTTLQHVLWEAENPFFLEVSHDDVHRAIHNELRKNIWKLPWLLDGMRVDLAVTKHGIDEPHVSNIIEVTTGKENLHFPTNFDAKFFVKQVKYLCADRHVSSALISSSEGLMMLSLGEPRLDKMLGRELPISKSKVYLKALGEENISEEMLMNMPRTFEKLRKLSASADKEAFCNKEMQGWVRTIKETNGQPFTNVKGLYQKALNEPIDIDDIRAATSGKLATLGGATPRRPLSTI